MTAAVTLEGVGKRFRLYSERNQSLKASMLQRRRSRYEEFWALRDVSFEITAGTTFGLIGENGSGKSTLLKCIARILVPDEGRVSSHGRVAALLELGSGFHPELSGRENVFLNGSILGMGRQELERKFDEIVAFSGIEHFIDQPVKNYSSGMYVRLGFSIAINVDPDVLLCDEVLAVGDTAFQRRCEERFSEFRSSGRTVVLVSHALSSMRSICDEVAWLERGRLLEVGAPFDVVDEYVDESHEDRVVLEDGGTRWGDGLVRVRAVQLLDRTGEDVSSFRTGDTMTFRLHYEAEHKLADPVFGFALESLDGAYVWAHNSRDGGMVPDFVEGLGYVDLVVPRLMLQPGVFDVTAAVTSIDGARTHDHRRKLRRFDVSPGVPRESGGYLALGGAWHEPASVTPTS